MVARHGGKTYHFTAGATIVVVVIHFVTAVVAHANAHVIRRAAARVVL